MKEFFKKFYIVLSLSLFLIQPSCVSNDDPPPAPPTPPVNRETVELNVENIKGTWEVYYFTKQTIAESLNLDATYRNTEYDGFTITFEDNGKYQERNVFGDLVVEGTYTFGKKDPKVEGENDLIYLNYIDTAGVKQINDIYIPNLFEETFAWYDTYHGDAQGVQFKVQDIRFYRHTERAPDYKPVDKTMEKNELSEDDLMNGRWELYKYEKRVDAQWLAVPDSIKKKYGEQYLFRYEKDSLRYYAFGANNHTQYALTGLALVVDDVIHMRWSGWVDKKDEEGNVKKEFQIRAFKWWVLEKIKTSSNVDALRDFDRYRDVKDVLKDVEESAYYKRINATKARNFNFEDYDYLKNSEDNPIPESCLPHGSVLIYPQR